MRVVHRTVLDVEPPEAFDRLRRLPELLQAAPDAESASGAGDDARARPDDNGAARAVGVDHGTCSVTYTLTSLDDSTMLRLRGDAQGDTIQHDVVVAPAVGGGSEVVWCTTAPHSADQAVRRFGSTVLERLTITAPQPTAGRRRLTGRAPVGASTTTSAAPLQPRPGDDTMMTVLDHVLLDHAYLRTQLDRVCRATPGERARMVGPLLDAVVRHDSAEARLLRPHLRAADGGAAIADRLDEQADAIRDHVAACAAANEDADDGRLRAALRTLRAAVLLQLDAEELAGHPRLRAHCSGVQLQDLGRRYVEMATPEVDVRERDDDVRTLQHADSDVRTR